MRSKLGASFLCALMLFAAGFSQNAYGQDPLPPRQKTGEYLDIAGSKIYYEQCGTGPAVVLLHDGLLHSITWDGAWDALCRRYHAVRYDRRGYGRSDPPKSRYSSTEDLNALLSQLNIQRAIVVGNSSGGALAIDFALAYPDKVEGLFLIGPVVGGMDTTSHFNERGSKNMAPLDKGDLKAAAENWSKDRYIIGPGQEAARKALYNALVQNPQNLKYSPEFAIQNPLPSLSRLAEIHVATSILVGEFDIPDVHAQSGAIEAGIPGAQRNILDNAGHLIQVEMPEAFTKRLGEFVDLQERKGKDVSAEILQSYVGSYAAGQIVVTIGVKDGQLVLQTPGQQPFPLFAESPTKFFLKLWDLQIEFNKDSSGKVVQAVIYEDGDTIKAPRL